MRSISQNGNKKRVKRIDIIRDIDITSPSSRALTTMPIPSDPGSRRTCSIVIEDDENLEKRRTREAVRYRLADGSLQGRY